MTSSCERSRRSDCRKSEILGNFDHYLVPFFKVSEGQS